MQILALTKGVFYVLNIRQAGKNIFNFCRYSTAAASIEDKKKYGKKR